jgi:hypothetical protein
MTVVYNKELSFSQEEYKKWFYQKGENGVNINEIRNELVKRGLKLSKKPNKFGLENYVFCRIIREIPNKFFSIYKHIVCSLSHNRILGFVSTQMRYHYGRRENYIFEVTKMIQCEYMYVYSKIQITNKKIEQCTCDNRFNYRNCSWCLYIMLKFTDDCIIKLGKHIFHLQLYKIFIYFQRYTKSLPKDIIFIVVNKYFTLSN